MWVNPRKVNAQHGVAPRLRGRRRRPDLDCVLRGSIPGSLFPLSTLGLRPLDRRPMTRGRNGWLGLSRRGLQPPTSRRFRRRSHVPQLSQLAARWARAIRKGSRSSRPGMSKLNSGLLGRPWRPSVARTAWSLEWLIGRVRPRGAHGTRGVARREARFVLFRGFLHALALLAWSK